MHHAGIQYGQGSMSSGQAQYGNVHDQSTVPSTTTTTTASLRQWRKKDTAVEKQPTIQQSDQTAPTETQGPIARVAPHAHYPRPTDPFRYTHQYPTEYGLNYKDLTPTPVKYSEIVEPQPAPQRLDHHLGPIVPKAKEKDYLEMCSVQQAQMKPYPEGVKHAYANMHPAMLAQNHHYVPKESQMHPYVPKEPPTAFTPYHLPNYKIPNHYHQQRQYPNEAAFPLALFNEQPLYHPQMDQRYQSQRMYRTQMTNYRAPPQPYPSPSQNYNYRPNVQNHDPYRMHHLPHTMQKYHEYKMPQHLENMGARNISPRRLYPDNLANYTPPRVSPNYQCSQMEYAQHYQNRRQIPTDYLQQHDPKMVAYMQNHHMPDLVTDNTPKPSLKQFLENWNDDIPDIQDANAAAAAAVAKEPGRIKEPGGDNLYILDSTEIPTESIQQFIHLQVDKLPENIKGFIGGPGTVIKGTSEVKSDGILNLAQDSVIRTNADPKRDSPPKPQETTPQTTVISETKKFLEVETHKPSEDAAQNEQNTVIVYNSDKQEEDKFLASCAHEITNSVIRENKTCLDFKARTPDSQHANPCLDPDASVTKTCLEKDLQIIDDLVDKAELLHAVTNDVPFEDLLSDPKSPTKIIETVNEVLKVKIAEELKTPEIDLTDDTKSNPFAKPSNVTETASKPLSPQDFSVVQSRGAKSTHLDQEITDKSRSPKIDVFMEGSPSSQVNQAKSSTHMQEFTDFSDESQLKSPVSNIHIVESEPKSLKTMDVEKDLRSQYPVQILEPPQTINVTKNETFAKKERLSVFPEDVQSESNLGEIATRPTEITTHDVKSHLEDVTALETPITNKSVTEKSPPIEESSLRTLTCEKKILRDDSLSCSPKSTGISDETIEIPKSQDLNIYDSPVDLAMFETCQGLRVKLPNEECKKLIPEVPVIAKSENYVPKIRSPVKNLQSNVSATNKSNQENSLSKEEDIPTISGSLKKSFTVKEENIPSTQTSESLKKSTGNIIVDSSTSNHLLQKPSTTQTKESLRKSSITTIDDSSTNHQLPTREKCKDFQSLKTAAKETFALESKIENSVNSQILQIDSSPTSNQFVEAKNYSKRDEFGDSGQQNVSSSIQTTSSQSRVSLEEFTNLQKSQSTELRKKLPKTIIPDKNQNLQNIPSKRKLEERLETDICSIVPSEDGPEKESKINKDLQSINSSKRKPDERCENKIRATVPGDNQFMKENRVFRIDDEESSRNYSKDSNIFWTGEQRSSDADENLNPQLPKPLNIPSQISEENPTSNLPKTRNIDTPPDICEAEDWSSSSKLAKDWSPTSNSSESRCSYKSSEDSELVQDYTCKLTKNSKLLKDCSSSPKLPEDLTPSELVQCQFSSSKFPEISSKPVKDWSSVSDSSENWSPSSNLAEDQKMCSSKLGENFSSKLDNDSSSPSSKSAENWSFSSELAENRFTFSKQDEYFKIADLIDEHQIPANSSEDIQLPKHVKETNSKNKSSANSALEILPETVENFEDEKSNDNVNYANAVVVEENCVLLQIAGELLEIKVIKSGNTGNKNIVSVIPYTECTVVAENNNNVTEDNLREEMVEETSVVESREETSVVKNLKERSAFENRVGTGGVENPEETCVVENPEETSAFDNRNESLENDTINNDEVTLVENEENVHKNELQMCSQQELVSRCSSEAENSSENCSHSKLSSESNEVSIDKTEVIKDQSKLDKFGRQNQNCKDMSEHSGTLDSLDPDVAKNTRKDYVSLEKNEENLNPKNYKDVNFVETCEVTSEAATSDGINRDELTFSGETDCENFEDATCYNSEDTKDEHEENIEHLENETTGVSDNSVAEFTFVDVEVGNFDQPEDYLKDVEGVDTNEEEMRGPILGEYMDFESYEIIPSSEVFIDEAGPVNEVDDGEEVMLDDCATVEEELNDSETNVGEAEDNGKQLVCEVVERPESKAENKNSTSSTGKLVIKLKRKDIVETSEDDKHEDNVGSWKRKSKNVENVEDAKDISEGMKNRSLKRKSKLEKNDNLDEYETSEVENCPRKLILKFKRGKVIDEEDSANKKGWRKKASQTKLQVMKHKKKSMSKQKLKTLATDAIDNEGEKTDTGRCYRKKNRGKKISNVEEDTSMNLRKVLVKQKCTETEDIEDGEKSVASQRKIVIKELVDKEEGSKRCKNVRGRKKAKVSLDEVEPQSKVERKLNSLEEDGKIASCPRKLMSKLNSKDSVEDESVLTGDDECEISKIVGSPRKLIVQLKPEDEIKLSSHLKVKDRKERGRPKRRIQSYKEYLSSKEKKQRKTEDCVEISIPHVAPVVESAVNAAEEQPISPEIDKNYVSTKHNFSIISRGKKERTKIKTPSARCKKLLPIESEDQPLVMKVKTKAELKAICKPQNSLKSILKQSGEKRRLSLEEYNNRKRTGSSDSDRSPSTKSITLEEYKKKRTGSETGSLERNEDVLSEIEVKIEEDRKLPGVFDYPNLYENEVIVKPETSSIHGVCVKTVRGIDPRLKNLAEREKMKAEVGATSKDVPLRQYRGRKDPRNVVKVPAKICPSHERKDPRLKPSEGSTSKAVGFCTYIDVLPKAEEKEAGKLVDESRDPGCRTTRSLPLTDNLSKTIKDEKRVFKTDLKPLVYTRQCKEPDVSNETPKKTVNQTPKKARQQNEDDQRKRCLDSYQMSPKEVDTIIFSSTFERNKGTNLKNVEQEGVKTIISSSTVTNFLKNANNNLEEPKAIRSHVTSIEERRKKIDYFVDKLVPLKSKISDNIENLPVNCGRLVEKTGGVNIKDDKKIVKLENAEENQRIDQEESGRFVERMKEVSHVVDKGVPLKNTDKFALDEEEDLMVGSGKCIETISDRFDLNLTSKSERCFVGVSDRFGRKMADKFDLDLISKSARSPEEVPSRSGPKHPDKFDLNTISKYGKSLEGVSNRSREKMIDRFDLNPISDSERSPEQVHRFSDRYDLNSLPKSEISPKGVLDKSTVNPLHVGGRPLEGLDKSGLNPVPGTGKILEAVVDKSGLERVREMLAFGLEEEEEELDFEEESSPFWPKLDESMTPPPKPSESDQTTTVPCEEVISDLEGVRAEMDELASCRALSQASSQNSPQNIDDAAKSSPEKSKIDDLSKKIDDIFGETLSTRKHEEDLIKRFLNGDKLRPDEALKAKNAIERKKYRHGKRNIIDLDEISCKLDDKNAKARKKDLIDLNDFNLDRPERPKPKSIIDLNELFPTAGRKEEECRKNETTEKEESMWEIESENCSVHDNSSPRPSFEEEEEENVRTMKPARERITSKSKQKLQNNSSSLEEEEKREVSSKKTGNSSSKLQKHGFQINHTSPISPCPWESYVPHFPIGPEYSERNEMSRNVQGTCIKSSSDGLSSATNPLEVKRSKILQEESNKMPVEDRTIPKKEKCKVGIQVEEDRSSTQGREKSNDAECKSSEITGSPPSQSFNLKKCSEHAQTEDTPFKGVDKSPNKMYEDVNHSGQGDAEKFRNSMKNFDDKLKKKRETVEDQDTNILGGTNEPQNDNNELKSSVDCAMSENCTENKPEDSEESLELNVSVEEQDSYDTPPTLSRQENYEDNSGNEFENPPELRRQDEYHKLNASITGGRFKDRLETREMQSCKISDELGVGTENYLQADIDAEESNGRQQVNYGDENDFLELNDDTSFSSSYDFTPKAPEQVIENCCYTKPQVFNRSNYGYFSSEEARQASEKKNQNHPCFYLSKPQHFEDFKPIVQQFKVTNSFGSKFSDHFPIGDLKFPDRFPKCDLRRKLNRRRYSLGHCDHQPNIPQWFSDDDQCYEQRPKIKSKINICSQYIFPKLYKHPTKKFRWSEDNRNTEKLVQSEIVELKPRPKKDSTKKMTEEEEMPKTTWLNSEVVEASFKRHPKILRRMSLEGFDSRKERWLDSEIMEPKHTRFLNSSAESAFELRKEKWLNSEVKICRRAEDASEVSAEGFQEGYKFKKSERYRRKSAEHPVTYFNNHWRYHFLQNDDGFYHPRFRYNSDGWSGQNKLNYYENHFEDDFQETRTDCIDFNEHSREQLVNPSENDEKKSMNSTRTKIENTVKNIAQNDRRENNENQAMKNSFSSQDQMDTTLKPILKPGCSSEETDVEIQAKEQVGELCSSKVLMNVEDKSQKYSNDCRESDNQNSLRDDINLNLKLPSGNFTELKQRNLQEDTGKNYKSPGDCEKIEIQHYLQEVINMKSSDHCRKLENQQRNVHENFNAKSSGLSQGFEKQHNPQEETNAKSSDDSRGFGNQDNLQENSNAKSSDNCRVSENQQHNLQEFKNKQADIKEFVDNNIQEDCVKSPSSKVGDGELDEFTSKVEDNELDLGHTSYKSLRWSRCSRYSSSSEEECSDVEEINEKQRRNQQNPKIKNAKESEVNLEALIQPPEMVEQFDEKSNQESEDAASTVKSSIIVKTLSDEPKFGNSDECCHLTEVNQKSSDVVQNFEIVAEDSSTPKGNQKTNNTVLNINQSENLSTLNVNQYKKSNDTNDTTLNTKVVAEDMLNQSNHTILKTTKVVAEDTSTQNTKLKPITTILKSEDVAENITLSEKHFQNGSNLCGTAADTHEDLLINKVEERISSCDEKKKTFDEIGMANTKLSSENNNTEAFLPSLEKIVNEDTSTSDETTSVICKDDNSFVFQDERQTGTNSVICDYPSILQHSTNYYTHNDCEKSFEQPKSVICVESKSSERESVIKGQIIEHSLNLEKSQENSTITQSTCSLNLEFSKIAKEDKHFDETMMKIDQRHGSDKYEEAFSSEWIKPGEEKNSYGSASSCGKSNEDILSEGKLESVQPLDCSLAAMAFQAYSSQRSPQENFFASPKDFTLENLSTQLTSSLSYFPTASKLNMLKSGYQGTSTTQSRFPKPSTTEHSSNFDDYNVYYQRNEDLVRLQEYPTRHQEITYPLNSSPSKDLETSRHQENNYSQLISSFPNTSKYQENTFSQLISLPPKDFKTSKNQENVYSQLILSSPNHIKTSRQQENTHSQLVSSIPKDFETSRHQENIYSQSISSLPKGLKTSRYQDDSYPQLVSLPPPPKDVKTTRYQENTNSHLVSLPPKDFKSSRHQESPYLRFISSSTKDLKTYTYTNSKTNSSNTKEFQMYPHLQAATTKDYKTYDNPSSTKDYYHQETNCIRHNLTLGIFSSTNDAQTWKQDSSKCDYASQHYSSHVLKDSNHLHGSSTSDYTSQNYSSHTLQNSNHLLDASKSDYSQVHAQNYTTRGLQDTNCFSKNEYNSVGFQLYPFQHYSSSENSVQDYSATGLNNRFSNTTATITGRVKSSNSSTLYNPHLYPSDMIYSSPTSSAAMLDFQLKSSHGINFAGVQYSPKKKYCSSLMQSGIFENDKQAPLTSDVCGDSLRSCDVPTYQSAKDSSKPASIIKESTFHPFTSVNECSPLIPFSSNPVTNKKTLGRLFTPDPKCSSARISRPSPCESRNFVTPFDPKCSFENIVLPSETISNPPACKSNNILTSSAIMNNLPTDESRNLMSLTPILMNKLVTNIKPENHPVQQFSSYTIESLATTTVNSIPSTTATLATITVASLPPTPVTFHNPMNAPSSMRASNCTTITRISPPRLSSIITLSNDTTIKDPTPAISSRRSSSSKTSTEDHMYTPSAGHENLRENMLLQNLTKKCDVEKLRKDTTNEERIQKTQSINEDGGVEKSSSLSKSRNVSDDKCEDIVSSIKLKDAKCTESKNGETCESAKDLLKQNSPDKPGNVRNIENNWSKENSEDSRTPKADENGVKVADNCRDLTILSASPSVFENFNEEKIMRSSSSIDACTVATSIEASNVLTCEKLKFALSKPKTFQNSIAPSVIENVCKAPKVVAHSKIESVKSQNDDFILNTSDDSNSKSREIFVPNESTSSIKDDCANPEWDKVDYEILDAKCYKTIMKTDKSHDEEKIVDTKRAKTIIHENICTTNEEMIMLRKRAVDDGSVNVLTDEIMLQDSVNVKNLDAKHENKMELDMKSTQDEERVDAMSKDVNFVLNESNCVQFEIKKTCITQNDSLHKKKKKSVSFEDEVRQIQQRSSSVIETPSNATSCIQHTGRCVELKISANTNFYEDEKDENRFDVGRENRDVLSKGEDCKESYQQNEYRIDDRKDIEEGYREFRKVEDLVSQRINIVEMKIDECDKKEDARKVPDPSCEILSDGVGEDCKESYKKIGREEDHIYQKMVAGDDLMMKVSDCDQREETRDEQNTNPKIENLSHTLHMSEKEKGKEACKETYKQTRKTQNAFCEETEVLSAGKGMIMETRSSCSQEKATFIEEGVSSLEGNRLIETEKSLEIKASSSETEVTIVGKVTQFEKVVSNLESRRLNETEKSFLEMKEVSFAGNETRKLSSEIGTNSLEKEALESRRISEISKPFTNPFEKEMSTSSSEIEAHSVEKMASSVESMPVIETKKFSSETKGVLELVEIEKSSKMTVPFDENISNEGRNTLLATDTTEGVSVSKTEKTLLLHSNICSGDLGPCLTRTECDSSLVQNNGVICGEMSRKEGDLREGDERCCFGDCAEERVTFSVEKGKGGVTLGVEKGQVTCGGFYGRCSSKLKCRESDRVGSRKKVCLDACLDLSAPQEVAVSVASKKKVFASGPSSAVRSRSDFKFGTDAPPAAEPKYKKVRFSDMLADPPRASVVQPLHVDVRQKTPPVQPRNSPKRKSIDDITKKLMSICQEAPLPPPPVGDEEKDLYESVLDSEVLKLHLKKVDNGKPTKKAIKERRSRKRRRFRNVHVVAESAGEAPQVNAQLSRPLCKDEDPQDYSVFESRTQDTGLPKLIIKRNVCDQQRDPLQPIVRIERDPNLDILAKRKRKN